MSHVKDTATLRCMASFQATSNITITFLIDRARVVPLHDEYDAGGTTRCKGALASLHDGLSGLSA